MNQDYTGPLVDHQIYRTPTQIQTRPGEQGEIKEVGIKQVYEDNRQKSQSLIPNAPIQDDDTVQDRPDRLFE